MQRSSSRSSRGISQNYTITTFTLPHTFVLSRESLARLPSIPFSPWCSFAFSAVSSSSASLPCSSISPSQVLSYTLRGLPGEAQAHARGTSIRHLVAGTRPQAGPLGISSTDCLVCALHAGQRPLVSLLPLPPCKFSSLWHKFPNENELTHPSVFFFLSMLVELALMRRHRKEKAFGPSPHNGYTAGSPRRKFWQRKSKRRDAEFAAAAEKPDVLPAHQTPADFRTSYGTDSTAVAHEPAYNKYGNTSMTGAGGLGAAPQSTSTTHGYRTQTTTTTTTGGYTPYRSENTTGTF